MAESVGKEATSSASLALTMLSAFHTLFWSAPMLCWKHFTAELAFTGKPEGIAKYFCPSYKVFNICKIFFQ